MDKFKAIRRGNVYCVLQSNDDGHFIVPGSYRDKFLDADRVAEELQLEADTIHRESQKFLTGVTVFSWLVFAGLAVFLVSRL